jgi:anaerobic selenocysteine-containing dehydrogenase
MIEAPDGLLEEWEMLWELAHRLGTGMPLAGGACPMDQRPSKVTFLDLMVAGCSVAPSIVRADTVDGKAVIYADRHPVVEAGDPDAPGRFDLTAGAMPDQLIAYAGAAQPTPDFPWRMVSRRSRHRFNSTGQNLPALRAKRTTNPAFLHPDDLALIPCADGDTVRIRSAAGEVVAVARAAENMRPGVVSMAHAFGGPDIGPDGVHEHGASTNRLVSESVAYDPITGQSLQSAIPVSIVPA